ncbi:hypothetical protein [Myxococcus llanfairpwllgwyngyllgogerychwyrndrobwllllantysiliogogogochensis]|uniref:Uncharacterized protein n=1 Tax=Myxococcus llanfairpwllgwyngyllgogerychwyrndrobwllllantysiliogogogochensis TaxID=2590453 RepID=A0A540WQ96_9BACT|nr:hypothetical protein [Myxococcus llanfairpwllgwyngyllgogerychwyrndrobwllllantysiliogogogochensis]NTX03695.1 hypothetical protein [Myxococcus sp. CA040A]TQF11188.1 hypothetical protein FJV41_35545 [Myxococcus llanfairpwllgwyngyllgogerychwyrndrobwllllantysiliogogogochensis]
MQELIDVLRHQARHFAPELSQLAYKRGLAVTQLDGTTRPIPITATPVILDAAEIRRRAELSARLSSATVKMARATLEGPDAQELLGALSPLERTLAERTWRQSARLATTRVDYFVSGGKPWALEVNATIPAMQGYSDIAARSFIEVVARHFRYPEKALASLLALNGSNALALYRALLDGYAAERPGKFPDTVALLCRRNDAQISELRWLCERFREMGADADLVHPDEVSGDDAFEVRGKKYDLVYRHLFVRRLEQTPSPWVEDFLGTVPGKKAVFLNPPASQVEVKSTFARLSQALAEPALAEAAGLTAEELEAVRTSVPWTRIFKAGPASGPDGGRLDDLVAEVARTPARFVLKRAWDYGGKAVFIGRSVGTVPYTERVTAAYGELLGWPELCARAAADPTGGGFVVQEIVDSPPEDHLLCEPNGTVFPASFFVDYSAYASVGLEKQPAWGGVCRGSLAEIVNIVGGGGVLPLITTEVASKLLLAWKAI